LKNPQTRLFRKKKSSASQVPLSKIKRQRRPALIDQVRFSFQEQTLSGLAHDARNLLSAIQVYCELIASPGVLTPRFLHYADDLLRLGETGSRLGERLIDALASAEQPATIPSPGSPSCSFMLRTAHPFAGIQNLALELEEMRPLLAALAGREVRFEMECTPCPGELGISSEDLLRILFNLVANAVEAINVETHSPQECPLRPTRFLRITAQRGGASRLLSRIRSSSEGPQTVLLSVRDSGPGIDPCQLAKIFDPGFSTRDASGLSADRPRGLGLSIVKQLVEQAGGIIRAVSSTGLGTRFDIELPLLDQIFVERNQFKASLPLVDTPRGNHPPKNHRGTRLMLVHLKSPSVLRKQQRPGKNCWDNRPPGPLAKR
jgi:signal transduction histidine kinase